MYRALAWKELRETWWMGAAACVCVIAAIWNELGLELAVKEFRVRLDTSFGRRLPFSDGEFTMAVVAATAGLGVLLGFWQTLFESVSGTWPFLMHRPLSCRNMLLGKLGTGAVLLAVATGLPLLCYALWAAVIGSRSQPFRWWMTAETGVLWFAALGVYLAAFLCGIREARWHVSRLWPLVPAVCLLLLPLELLWLAGLGWWLALAALLDVALVGAILHAAGERDFS